MTKREVKFRVWVEKVKRMHPVVVMEFIEKEGLSIVVWKIERISQQEEPFGFGNTSITLKDTILMRYTGLSDKNGREIYEGDVVKVKEFNDELGEVWFSPTGMWLWGDKEKEVGECFMKNETYEVVGNIYENPGLLKEAK